MVTRPLTQALLKELLDYSPDTGTFTWRKARGNQPAGATAGGSNHAGHISIGVNGTKFLAHRLAWLYVTGEWPGPLLDHENTNGEDNRWNNLREATPAQNSHNTKARKNNTLGYRGLRVTGSGRFNARVSVNNKCINAGTFDTAEEAANAARIKRNELHGAFANHA